MHSFARTGLLAVCALVWSGTAWAQPVGPPTNINTLYQVEYADPAYRREGPFYIRSWPGASPFTSIDHYYDIPGKCAPPSIVIDGDKGSGPFVAGYGRGTGSPVNIHPNPAVLDAWLFFWGDSLRYPPWSYTAFGQKYDCPGNQTQQPEGFIYVFRYEPSQQRYFESFRYWWVGDTLFCHLDKPWFQPNGAANQVQATYCNWYATWSQQQFYPPGTSPARVAASELRLEAMAVEPLIPAGVSPELQGLAESIRQELLARPELTAR